MIKSALFLNLSPKQIQIFQKKMTKKTKQTCQRCLKIHKGPNWKRDCQRIYRRIQAQNVNETNQKQNNININNQLPIQGKAIDQHGKMISEEEESFSVTSNFQYDRFELPNTHMQSRRFSGLCNFNKWEWLTPEEKFRQYNLANQQRLREHMNTLYEKRTQQTIELKKGNELSSEDKQLKEQLEKQFFSKADLTEEGNYKGSQKLDLIEYCQQYFYKPKGTYTAQQAIQLITRPYRKQDYDPNKVLYIQRVVRKFCHKRKDFLEVLSHKGIDDYIDKVRRPNLDRGWKRMSEIWKQNTFNDIINAFMQHIIVMKKQKIKLMEMDQELRTLRNGKKRSSRKLTYNDLRYFKRRQEQKKKRTTICHMRRDLMRIHRDIMNARRNKTKPIFKMYLPRELQTKVCKKPLEKKNAYLRQLIAITYKNPFSTALLGVDIRRQLQRIKQGFINIETLQTIQEQGLDKINWDRFKMAEHQEQQLRQQDIQIAEAPPTNYWTTNQKSCGNKKKGFIGPLEAARILQKSNVLTEGIDILFQKDTLIPQNQINQLWIKNFIKNAAYSPNIILNRGDGQKATLTQRRMKILLEMNEQMNEQQQQLIFEEEQSQSETERLKRIIQDQ